VFHIFNLYIFKIEEWRAHIFNYVIFFLADRGRSLSRSVQMAAFARATRESENVPNCSEKGRLHGRTVRGAPVAGATVSERGNAGTETRSVRGRVRGAAVGEGSPRSRGPRQLGSNCRARASLVVGVNACAGGVVVLMVWQWWCTRKVILPLFPPPFCRAPAFLSLDLKAPEDAGMRWTYTHRENMWFWQGETAPVAIPFSGAVRVRLAGVAVTSHRPPGYAAGPPSPSACPFNRCASRGRRRAVEEGDDVLNFGAARRATRTSSWSRSTSHHRVSLSLPSLRPPCSCLVIALFSLSSLPSRNPRACTVHIAPAPNVSVRDNARNFSSPSRRLLVRRPPPRASWMQSGC